MKKKLLIFAFFAVFMFLGIMALKDGMPAPKNERVYIILQKHMPYTLEKRVGGYSIVSNETGVKEKPPAKDLFLRLEQLEKLWGKDFLRFENNTLIVLDKNKNEVEKIDLKTNEEINWVKEYFNF
ncbi:MAG: hypothetical protein EOM78_10300 [Erysipelotrichia bacterium]|nr:hypothetical protein [Erysipelotrichia bacterium]